MTTLSHQPKMTRTRYDEDSVKGTLATASSQMIGEDKGKRILDSILITNRSGTDEVFSLYAVDPTSGEIAGDNTVFGCDIPIKAKETILVPPITLQATWELWGDASQNTVINYLVSFRKEF